MLEGENISVSFGDQIVLQDVSIRLKAGERVALLGPSGAGKSTLLRILSGIQLPNVGRVSFEGIQPYYDLNASASRTVRKWVWPKVTLVFQDLQLFPNLTAEENCKLGWEPHDFISSAEIPLLGVQLNVSKCFKKLPKYLSQGEQQRIAIIRGIAKKPHFLLLDEPTSALDPIAKSSVCHLLIEKSVTTNMGILVATHDWEFATKVANSFVVIRNGKLGFFETILEATAALSGISQ